MSAACQLGPVSTLEPIGIECHFAPAGAVNIATHVQAAEVRASKGKLEMSAVTTQWQRIEAHLQKDARISQPFLNPGATEEEIVEAETALGGIRFPDDFRASLKRHNGQATYAVLLGIGALLSTKEIVTEWSLWKELLDAGSFVDDDAESSPGPGVKAHWWNPRWIPITHDSGGDHECLDMDPAEGGTVGQIMEMWHDDGARPLKAPGFLAWLTACASQLEDGSLDWEEGSGFVSKEDRI